MGLMHGCAAARIYSSYMGLVRQLFRWPEYSLPENCPRKVPPRLFPPRNIPPMKSMHGNNVVWLCTKYAVDANLFRLESSILTRVKRATNRNNVVREYSLEVYIGVEHYGWNFPGGSIPRTVINRDLLSINQFYFRNKSRFTCNK